MAPSPTVSSSASAACAGTRSRACTDARPATWPTRHGWPRTGGSSCCSATGLTGARPLGDVTASWRVGGGLVGEVPAAEITSLLGAVNGVRKITGVGVMSGAADQEDPLRMRRAAAARLRALDRAVACRSSRPGADRSRHQPQRVVAGGGTARLRLPSRSGIHVAVLRLAASGVRAPSDAELHALGGYLDARRDTTVGICVCAAVPSPVEVGALVAVDPRRDSTAVLAAMQAALLDPTGPLAPLPRELGEPLDGSDVIEIARHYRRRRHHCPDARRRTGHPGRPVARQAARAAVASCSTSGVPTWGYAPIVLSVPQFPRHAAHRPCWPPSHRTMSRPCSRCSAR